MNRLRDLLRRIDGRSYAAYRDIRGTYDFNRFELQVVHVQGDPFAAPSRLAIRIPLDDLPLSDEDVENPSRRTGAEDALLRGFADTLYRAGGSRGSGKSGLWGALHLGQHMLPQTGCEILDDDFLVVRFTAGLPARGRRVLGRQAASMLLDDLPGLVRSSLLGANTDVIRRHADACEDQDTLRSLLEDRGWVAFVADGSILPRRTGVDDRPMLDGAVPWTSPEEIRETVELPNAGEVTGSAIANGITLICGGGYHGKSTLLRALASGVYNKIPGDGRELMATRDDTVFIRAEDGRRVCNTDISCFIGSLPDGRDTSSFSTDNASGSTSQAANIVEALELGCGCLLIDEDTSATNFMTRDKRMHQLVPPESEPIIPFSHRSRELLERMQVSTILVVGSTGDFFADANLVLTLSSYVPAVSTARAHEIAKEHPLEALDGHPPLAPPAGRVPARSSFKPKRGRRDRVRARGTRSISFGEQEIEVGLLAQLVHDAQTRTIADWILRYARDRGAERPLKVLCEELEDRGWDLLSETTERGFGDRILTRRFEVGAAINRLRSLRIR